MTELYESLGMDEFIEKALLETRIYTFNGNGEEGETFCLKDKIERDIIEQN